MDTTILKVNNNSEWAAAFLEYVKSLPFVEIELPKAKGKAIASPSVEILEEDEDGIPIAHRDFIMELSKETNINIARRLSERFNIPYEV